MGVAGLAFTMPKEDGIPNRHGRRLLAARV